MIHRLRKVGLHQLTRKKCYPRCDVLFGGSDGTQIHSPRSTIHRAWCQVQASHGGRKQPSLRVAVRLLQRSETNLVRSLLVDECRLKIDARLVRELEEVNQNVGGLIF